MSGGVEKSIEPWGVYYFIVSERQMVSLPLIKICELFPLDYSPGSRKKKTL